MIKWEDRETRKKPIIKGGRNIHKIVGYVNESVLENPNPEVKVKEPELPMISETPKKDKK